MCTQDEIAASQTERGQGETKQQESTGLWDGLGAEACCVDEELRGPRLVDHRVGGVRGDDMHVYANNGAKTKIPNAQHRRAVRPIGHGIGSGDKADSRNSAYVKSTYASRNADATEQRMGSIEHSNAGIRFDVWRPAEIVEHLKIARYRKIQPRPRGKDEVTAEAYVRLEGGGVSETIPVMDNRVISRKASGGIASNLRHA